MNPHLIFCWEGRASFMHVHYNTLERQKLQRAATQKWLEILVSASEQLTSHHKKNI